MPFINTKTNVTISKEQEITIKERLGQAISLIPGKSESWLMLAIEGDVPMYFRGEGAEPVAYVEVKVYGGATHEACNKMTAAITELFGEVLNISPDHLYVSYFGTEDWGWNGNNF